MTREGNMRSAHRMLTLAEADLRLAGRDLPADDGINKMVHELYGLRLRVGAMVALLALEPAP